MARFLGLTWSYPRATATLGLSLSVFWKLVLFGIIAGLAAYLLVLVMEGLHHGMERLKSQRHWWPPLFPMMSGVALAILMLAVGRSYNGLSLLLLSHALSGHPVSAFGWAWKLLAVGITLGFGMSGGIITPLFVIGAALGSTLAIPFRVPLAIGAELGMIAVTAAGANTPITRASDCGHPGLYHHRQQQRLSQPTGSSAEVTMGPHSRGTGVGRSVQRLPAFSVDTKRPLTAPAQGEGETRAASCRKE